MANQSSTILAFDYGQRRIGVACGQTLTATASPLTTLNSVQQQPNWKAIEQLITEWQPSHLVVGLPLRQDGSESGITNEARLFAKALAKRSQLPIDLHNETLTSSEAEGLLREQRQSGKRSKRVQKDKIDQMAATLILQSWLDENKNN